MKNIKLKMEIGLVDPNFLNEMMKKPNGGIIDAADIEYKNGII